MKTVSNKAYRAMNRLLSHYFSDIDYNYEDLTESEKAVVSKEEFMEIVKNIGSSKSAVPGYLHVDIHKNENAGTLRIHHVDTGYTEEVYMLLQAAIQCVSEWGSAGYEYKYHLDDFNKLAGEQS